MNELLFKTEFKENLYNSLNVLMPDVEMFIPGRQVDTPLYSYLFHYYVSMAEFLLDKSNKFVMIKASPFLVQQYFIKQLMPVSWKYEVLADDYNGLGINKGFVPVGLRNNDSYVVTSLQNLLLLKQLPEDTFGDKVNHCSIFGLTDNRFAALQHFLTSPMTPDLPTFLQEGESFINIATSKSVGFYHTMLISSRENRQSDVDIFQNILSPNN